MPGDCALEPIAYTAFECSIATSSSTCTRAKGSRSGLHWEDVTSLHEAIVSQRQLDKRLLGPFHLLRYRSLRQFRRTDKSADDATIFVSNHNPTRERNHSRENMMEIDRSHLPCYYCNIIHAKVSSAPYDRRDKASSWYILNLQCVPHTVHVMPFRNTRTTIIARTQRQRICTPGTNRPRRETRSAPPAA